MENNGIVRRHHPSAAHVARLLEIMTRTHTKCVDEASLCEETGKDGSAWLRMAQKEGVEIVKFLDQADRDGIEVPDVPAVGSIPTRFKLREEVSRLRAQLITAEAAVEDARTLRLAATSRRERAEEGLRVWKVLAAAAVVLAVLSWI